MSVNYALKPEPEDQATELHLKLDRLRARILASDITTCFIERELLLKTIKPEVKELPSDEQYSYVFKHLLEHVTTPIEQDDVFLGRFVTGKWSTEIEASPFATVLNPVWSDIEFLVSPGHFTPNWETLINKGFDQLVRESWVSAKRHGTDDAKWFAENAETCCNAVNDFARKYAQYAKKIASTALPENRDTLLRAANALEVVPAGPAPDFFSALQSIWIVWMVSSGYVGQRDLTYGRMDQYLYPLYRKGIEDGTLTPELAISYVAHLFLKNKELTGMSSDNYNIQPIPCFGSNQYATIGGRGVDGEIAVNELTYCILKAKTLSDVPQPGINIRIDADYPQEFKTAVYEAVEAHPDQIFLKNDQAFINLLETRMPHLERNDLMNYCFWPCNHLDFPGQNYFTANGWYFRTPKMLVSLLEDAAQISSFDDLLDRFKAKIRDRVSRMADYTTQASKEFDKRRFHYESVIMDSCIEKCQDVQTGGVKYVMHRINVESIGTIADSLMTIKRLVFEEKRFSLDEFMAIVNSEYENHESLRQEILHRIPKYGNGIDEVDDLGALIFGWICEAADELQARDDRLIFAQIYGEYNHLHNANMGATPDGRKQGQPLSRDQNPNIGMDTKDLTARLKSTAKVALPNSDGGATEIRFSKLPPREIFWSLIDTYFNMGGKVFNCNVASLETLRDAQKNPEEYQSLTVRLTGYSDYFVNISPAIQEDIISRTEY